jgi:hypothetical protein
VLAAADIFALKKMQYMVNDRIIIKDGTFKIHTIINNLLKSKNTLS